MRTPAPLLLRAPTRAAGLPRTVARAGLAALAAAVLLSLLAIPAAIALAPPPVPGTAAVTDLDLYAQIVDGVRWQGGYYPVAAEALREGGYPLRPFVAFRLPTLAVLQAWLPPLGVPVLLWLLAAATVTAWYARLAPALARVSARMLLALLLFGGTLAAWQAALAPFHELWAGLLVALALALHRPGRWLPTVALGLSAALIRETAALFLLVMAADALVGRRRDEAAGWGAALGAFALVLAVHAHAAGLVTRPLDPVSPGWTGLLGPGFAIRALVTATGLSLLPMALAAPLAVLGVAGWIGWRDPAGVRVAGLLLAFLALLAVAARADTFYWALTVAPLALAGLVFVPDLVRDLAHAALDTRRITVRRVVR